MQVFNAYFKILKKNAISISIYIAVSIIMSFMLSGSGTVVDQVFSNSKRNVAVIDRDHKDMAKALSTYFDTTNNLIELEDDIDKLQDALFYRNIDLLVVVPEGFTDSFKNDGNVELELTSAPGSMNVVFLNMQLENVLSYMKTYLKLGLSTDEALDKTLDVVSKETQTNIVTFEDSEVTEPDYASFFQFMGYGLVASLITAIGSVLVAFNKSEITGRMNCSATPLRKKNLQLILASVATTFFVWLLYIIIILISYGKAAVSNPMLPYLLINSFMIALTGLALGFLFGTISKHDGHISMYCVSSSLFLAFLGGVFVPIEFLSEGVLRVSKFLPTYWYIVLTDELLSASKLTDNLKGLMKDSLLAQAAFIVCILAVTVLITSHKSGAKKATA